MRMFLTTVAIASLATAGSAFAQGAAPAPAAAPASPAASNAASAAAAPAATSSVTTGATVYDTQGGIVGKIEAVDAQHATLATAKSKVKLPLASFGPGDKGPVLAMTAAQVDTAAGQASGAATASAGATAPASAMASATPAPGATAAAGAAATPPKLAKGLAVTDPSGGPVGTIEEVSGEYATVATDKNKVRLPLNAFAVDATGAKIGLTVAELDKAAEAAKPKTAAR